MRHRSCCVAIDTLLPSGKKQHRQQQVLAVARTASGMANHDARGHLQKGNLHSVPSAEEALARGPAGRVSPEVKGRSAGFVHLSERTGPRLSADTVRALPSGRPARINALR